MTGIIFAAIVLLPEMSVYFFFVPFPIPAPLFAVGYIVLSTYLMRRGGGQTSHEAHVAGAISGLLLGGLLAPGGFGPLLHRIQNLLIEGQLLIDLEGRTVELNPRQGFVVPNQTIGRIAPRDSECGACFFS